MSFFVFVFNVTFFFHLAHASVHLVALFIFSRVFLFLGGAWSLSSEAVSDKKGEGFTYSVA